MSFRCGVRYALFGSGNSESNRKGPPRLQSLERPELAEILETVRGANALFVEGTHRARTIEIQTREKSYPPYEFLLPPRAPG